LSALQKLPERYLRYYQKILLIVSLTTMPLALFVAVFAQECTLLVLGEKWRDAAFFVRMFALAAAFRPAMATTAVVVISCGMPRRLVLLCVLHGIVLASLMFLGLSWGAEGVAVAQVLASVVLVFPNLYYSFWQTPIKVADFFRATRLPLIASMGMAAGLVAFRHFFPSNNIWASLGFGGVMAGGLFLAIALVLPGGTRELMRLGRDLLSSLPGTRPFGNKPEPSNVSLLDKPEELAQPPV
jgi:O-antigen/teichoic acid export membrane protein